MSLPEGRTNADATVTLSQEQDLLLVQFGERESWMGSFEEIAAVTSVFIDRTTGEVLNTRRDLPRIEDISPTQAISQESLPFPNFKLWVLR
jgi:hypothetical protein